MFHRFQVVPASYVIFRRDDHVLLQLRQGTGYMDGYWATAAAGHVEAGEPAALEWFPLDELPAAVVPHERYVLDRLRSAVPAVVAFGFEDA